jgi:hypothetical protein
MNTRVSQHIHAAQAATQQILDDKNLNLKKQSVRERERARA